MAENDGASHEGMLRKLISFLPDIIKYTVRLAADGKDNSIAYFFWTIGLIAGLALFGIWYANCDSPECEKLGLVAVLTIFVVIITALVLITVMLSIVKIYLNSGSKKQVIQKPADGKKQVKSSSSPAKKKATRKSRKSKKQEITG